eukprot:gene38890-52530_t
MRRIASDDVPAAIVRMSSHEDGLTAAEAENRRARFGPNEVGHEKPLPWWMHLWHCYKNPFNVLLTVLALISYLTEDHEATVVILAMVVLSTLLRFVQEGRSNRAAERLKSLVSNTATVLRRQAADEQAVKVAEEFGIRIQAHKDARQVELPIRDLVPGDHVVLSAGDMIPADCRLLTAKDLFVAQAAMTGESLPVEKFADIGHPFETVFDAPNLVFMGTNVVSGSATALVIATGESTYFGALSARVTARDRSPTAFEAGVNGVSWLLIRFALVMVPIVLLINGFTKGDWMEAFLFALSVAVGLTPDAVVITDSAGAILMANPAFVRLARQTDEAQVRGKPLPQLLFDAHGGWARLIARTCTHGIVPNAVLEVGTVDTRTGAGSRGHMRRRREWFEPMENFMALWWVAAGHRPTPAEALARLDLLARMGPTADAFTFRQPFPAPAAVIVFPGSNCDRDCKVAIERSTGAHVDMVWH